MSYKSRMWELKSQFYSNILHYLSLITNEALKLVLQDSCSFSLFFLFFFSLVVVM